MDTLTTTEVARRLSIDQSRVRKLCRTGRLGRKFGHVWMITEADVEAYLQAGPRKAGRPKGSR